MFFEFDNEKLYYEINGTGKPLVFIHGFPFRTNMWEKQVEYFSNKGYKVITVDLRGHGNSTGIPDSIEQMGNDIFSLIDNLSINKPVIAGMSMGGYIAFDMSVRFPNKFSAGIYISTKAEGDNDNVKSIRDDLVADIKIKGSDSVAEFYMPKLFSPNTSDNKLINTVKEWIINNKNSSLIGATVAMRNRTDNTMNLKKIEFPALIIAGNDDPMIPKGTVKTECNLITTCNYEIIKEAGHMANMEKPDIVNKIIFNFLNKI